MGHTQSKIWILIGDQFRTEELLDVEDGIKVVTSGTHEDATETGNISWGKLDNIVEAEARLGKDGTVCSHPDFGRGTGGWNNKIVTNKMELELLPGLINVDGDVVTIVHLLFDVSIHFDGIIGFVGDLDM